MWLAAAGATWALVGLSIRWQRVEGQRPGSMALGGLLLMTVAVALFGPPWAWLGGIPVGVGIFAWRDLDPQWEGLWVVGSAGFAALVLYGLGFLAAIGIVGGAIAAAGLLRWWKGGGRLDEPDDAFSVEAYRHHVLVCYGAHCQIRGAAALRLAMARDRRFRRRDGVRVSLSACLGDCEHAPICAVEPEGRLMRAVEVSRIGELLQSLEHEEG